MVDLETTYLGMSLRSPLVASASPLTGRIGALLDLEEAGAGAVVLQSLFEEQIEREEVGLHHILEVGADAYGEALTYLPDMDDYNTGPRGYLEFLGAAKALLDIPVIASLNGTSTGGWVTYATLMENAGADAIELNVYFVAADPTVDGAEVEARYLDLVSAVRDAVAIPVAVKVGPYFSSMANMAIRLEKAGANGLVLFNRFIQPDIDLEDLVVAPGVELSTSAEVRLPLRWIALLREHISGSLAATTGIHTSADALKAILVGADAVMMTSALLRHGPDHLGDVLRGVAEWLEEHGYTGVDQARGSLSSASVPDPSAFERSNYMQALMDYTSRLLD
jgi:dihydroorotate dehydrogenase (fumarate)